MITLHSIDLRSTSEPCFAKMAEGSCRALSVKIDTCGTCECPFYKPDGAKDWIRVEDSQGINLIPPEEYQIYRRRK